MRVSSISSVNYSVKAPIQKKDAKSSQELVKNENAFKSKYPITKAFGKWGAVIGTVAAAGGVVLMTGGIGAAALPVILGYGATAGGSGAAIGYMIEKPDKKDSEKK